MLFACTAWCLLFQVTDNINECHEKYAHINWIFARFKNEEELSDVRHKSEELLKSKLIREPYGEFIKRRLILIIDEADYILTMNDIQRSQIMESIKHMRNLQNIYENKFDEYSEKKMYDAIKNVQIKTNNKSPTVYEAIMVKAIFDISKDFEKYNLSSIKNEHLKYKDIFGEKSPELFRFFIIYIHYFQLKKDLKMTSMLCLELKKLIPNGYPNRYEIVFDADLMYIEALSTSKDSLNELYSYYTKIDKTKVMVFNSKNIDSRILYFRICQKMFADLNSNYRMIEMQEFLVGALVYKYGNKDNIVVKNQAIILRDMLANNNEKKWFRKVESDFNLMPLPKQSGE